MKREIYEYLRNRGSGSWYRIALMAFSSFFLGVTLYIFLWAVLRSPTTALDMTAIFEDRMRSAEQELQSIDARLGALETSIDTLSQVPEQSAVGAELSQLSADTEALRVSMSNLEEVILGDPLQAVAIPLLRNDLESLDSRQQADIAAIRQEIAQVYNLATWVIGLMFTMAVGIFVLAVAPFFKKQEKQEGEPE